MRLHRFYMGSDQQLSEDFWLHEPAILHQWHKVLRFTADAEVVLFDGLGRDRLYRLVEIKPDEAHLHLITEMQPKKPAQNIYLLWSLLKKDKNDWVLQKATELGASHLWPLLADRSEKTGFNLERARKIIIEAVEQCGRSDIPTVREPMHVQTALTELKDKADLYICEQSAEESAELRAMSSENQATPNSPLTTHNSEAVGILVGPEGGWSDAEKQLFGDQELQHLNLHDFTLRAETASIAAITKLLQ